MNEERLVHELYHQIVRLEQHEASEWFRYNGVAVFNEHDLEEKERKAFEQKQKEKGGPYQ